MQVTYECPKCFLNTGKKDEKQPLHRMEEPGILWVWELQQTAKAVWHRGRSPVTLFTQTYNPWNWRWESLSPSPSLTRSIIPQGLPTHHFPITEAGDSSTSCPGKVDVGVMKLTATQISCTFSLFSSPLSHSITSKHHSESIFSFLWLSTPFLRLPKSHVTFLCMVWFSTVNVVLGLSNLSLQLSL